MAHRVPRCKKCNHDHYNYQNCPDGKVLTNPIQTQVGANGQFRVSGGWGQPFGTGRGKPWGGTVTYKHPGQFHGALTYPVRLERKHEEPVKQTTVSNQFESGGSLTVPD